jgi:molybdopterin converting factor small subunit
MNAAHIAPQSQRPDAKTLAKTLAKTFGIGVVLALLAAFVAYAALRELRKATPDSLPQATVHALSDRRPAQSAAEERFSQALWNVHAEVRTAAVRMTFAGLAYKMGDGDSASVNTKVAPLSALFRQAESQLRALDAPASMQELRGRYAGALQLYEGASQEMVKVAYDGKDAHLLKAQQMSEQASGILLEVGEQLWPGEVKPN